MRIEFEKTPAWRRYLRFWGSNAMSDLDAELRFHIESRTAELVAAGRSEEDARRAAEQRLGDLEAVRASCDALIQAREARMRRAEWLWEARQDLRYGWRSLLHAPAFAVVAILSLALGIGATTSIFGLLYTVLFARLPLPDAKQLIEVARVVEAGAPAGKGPRAKWFRFSDYQALAGVPGLNLAARTSTGLTVMAGEDRTFGSVELVSGTYFPVLGARPLLGRLLTPEDDRSATPVVVVSAEYWQQHLGGDESALGRTISVAGVPFTLVGVTEARFRGIMFPGRFQAAIPLSTANLVGLTDVHDPNNASLSLIGRLPQGDNAVRVQSAVQGAFAECCVRSAARKNRNVERIELRDLSRGMASPKVDVRGQFTPLLLTLMAGVCVFLLIACVNVGTLLLARAETRRAELAVRLALGAGRGRLIRQLLTESLQIAIAGAVVGYLFARWGLVYLTKALPEPAAEVIGLVELGTNKPVLAFTLIVTVICSVLFGIVPALRATRIELASQMKEGSLRAGGRRSGSLDRVLITAQIALALLLVSTAGLLVQTLRNLRHVEGGFDRSSLLITTVETRGTLYETSGIVPLHQAMLERILRLPAVRSAGMALYAPIYGGRQWSATVQVPGYQPGADEDLSTHLNATTPNFFRAAGIPLWSGRDFNDADQANAERVVIVSEAFARRYFSESNPIGATIHAGIGDARIVGVAADVRYFDLREPAEPTVYFPVSQSSPDWPFLTVVVRTNGPPLNALADIQREVLAVAPGLTVQRAMDMDQAIDEVLVRERMAAGLAFLFGLLALALAAVGVYGVMAYYINGRTAEIGIRMALGAGATGVVWLVVRQSLVMLLAGAAIGAPLAVIAGRAIATQLYGIDAFDPITLSAAFAVLIATGIAASLLPARRAARVQPLNALRAK